MREAVWICKACQYNKERVVESQDETSPRRSSSSMYQHGMVAAFFAERAVETAHRGYVVLIGLGTLARGPEDIIQYLHYPDSLPQQ